LNKNKDLIHKIKAKNLIESYLIGIKRENLPLNLERVTHSLRVLPGCFDIEPSVLKFDYVRNPTANIASYIPTVTSLMNSVKFEDSFKKILKQFWSDKSKI